MKLFSPADAAPAPADAPAPEAGVEPNTALPTCCDACVRSPGLSGLFCCCTHAKTRNSEQRRTETPVRPQRTTHNMKQRPNPMHTPTRSTQSAQGFWR